MSDKRKVATDALETLGKVFPIGTGKRDAIHLAVEPCKAKEKLYPGQHIGIVDGWATTQCEKKLGIVDPFLQGYVPEGWSFWMVIYPRTITSLRHVWEHPDFLEVTAEEDKRAKSEQWLRDFCKRSDCPPYEDLIKAAIGESINEHYGASDIDDEYFTIRGQDACGSIPNEFWDHIEVVTGRSMPIRSKYFSCSC